MKTLLIGLLIVLFSCQSTPTKQKTDITDLSSDSNKSNSALKIGSVSPILVDFKEKSDSMILNLNDEQFLITSLGKVFKKNKLLFDIKPRLRNS